MRVSDNIQDLIGVGTELLVDRQGYVIAKFYDGSLMVHTPVVASGADPTLVLDI